MAPGGGRAGGCTAVVEGAARGACAPPAAGRAPPLAYCGSQHNRFPWLLGARRPRRAPRRTAEPPFPRRLGVCEGPTRKHAPRTGDSGPGHATERRPCGGDGAGSGAEPGVTSGARRSVARRSRINFGRSSWLLRVANRGARRHPFDAGSPRTDNAVHSDPETRSK